MGVIVNETTTLPSGLEISGYYASVGRLGEMTTSKDQFNSESESGFHTRGNIYYWVSKDARLANKPPIHTNYISVNSNTAPTVSAYQTIYDKFKEGLTNYTDDM